MLRRFLNDQRGQSATDFMGMLLVVAVIIGAVAVSGAGEKIATHADELICRIAGGENCKKPGSPATNPYEPTYPCVTAGATNKVTLNGSFNVRFINVKLEGGVEYERVQRADGTVAVTVRLSSSAGAGLAGKLKEQLPTGLDAAIKGGQEGGITFVLPDNDAANTFAGQLKETAAALAAGPIVSRIKGWDAHIDFPPVESVYYQTGPGATLSYSANAGTAYGEGKLDVQHAVGARYNVQKKETTVYYKVSGSAEGGVGSLGQHLGLSGKADGQIAVTVDSHGRPTKLSVLVNGQGELVGGAGGRFRNLEQLSSAIKASGVGADVNATDGHGKRFEAQLDLDLTDPAVRNSALAFLQGVNPVTGNPADAQQAGEDLWNALKSNSQVSYRTYDTESSKRGGKIDVAGNGGGATYESTDRELTGAYYYDPTRGGFVPWEACRKS